MCFICSAVIIPYVQLPLVDNAFLINDMPLVWIEIITVREGHVTDDCTASAQLLVDRTNVQEGHAVARSYTAKAQRKAKAKGWREWVEKREVLPKTKPLRCKNTDGLRPISRCYSHSSSSVDGDGEQELAHASSASLRLHHDPSVRPRPSASDDQISRPKRPSATPMWWFQQDKAYIVPVGG